MSHPRFFRAGLPCAAVALLWTFGCASAPDRRIIKPPAPPAETDPALAVDETSFTLNVGDELDVKFPYRADFNEKEVVRPDGKISLPLIGSVTAEGKTPEALQQELAERFRAIGAEPGSVPKYRIHENDEHEIRFTHEESLDQLVRVRPDGRISLRIVKTIMAKGKTPEELEQELIAAYRPALKAPDLVVIVKNASSQEVDLDGQIAHPPIHDLEEVAVLVRNSTPRKIYVGGEVLKPGALPYTGPTTALSAILESGGAKATGKIAQVIVLRRSGAAPVMILLNLKKDLRGQASNDIALRANDVVFVPKTAVAGVAQFLDQYLFSILPLARNSSFTFVKSLSTDTRVVVPAGTTGS